MSLGYYEFLVSDADDGILLKSFLRQKCGLSARSLKVIKYDGGSVTCEDQELRSCDRVKAGTVITVQLPAEQCDITPVDGTLDILYEDDTLLIVNKPAFMPVHPTKIHQLDTLANIVSAYQRQRGEAYTFRALNRLDKDTSGCVVIAKDRIAYTLVLPTVQKTYLAVCEGKISDSGVIVKPIALSFDSKIKRCVSEEGLSAITHYEPIQYANGHTMCRIWLETGRTHQIRCHMSAIGYPLAGDDLYGGSMDMIVRQALHCQSVSLCHPVTGERINLSTEIPPEMSNIITDG